jgi:hypothetical protein
MSSKNNRLIPFVCLAFFLLGTNCLPLKAQSVKKDKPAGKMEEHFKAISKGALSKLSEEEKDKFRQANGFKVVGPALTYDKTKQ